MKLVVFRSQPRLHSVRCSVHLESSYRFACFFTRLERTHLSDGPSRLSNQRRPPPVYATALEHKKTQTRKRQHKSERVNTKATKLSHSAASTINLLSESLPAWTLKGRGPECPGRSWASISGLCRRTLPPGPVSHNQRHYLLAQSAPEDRRSRPKCQWEMFQKAPWLL